MIIEPNDVSRPFAYADPRSLSQAWFDALYADRRPPRLPAAPSASREPAKPENGAVARIVNTPSAQDGVRGGEHAAPSAGADRRGVPIPLGVPRDEREAARATRGSDMPSSARFAAHADRTDIDITTPHGDAVRIAMREDAGGVHVVAICAPDAATRIAEALTQARLVLAARGIRFTHTTTERATP